MKFSRVIIKVRDYRNSFEFYKNILGLKLTQSWQRKDSWGALFSAGNAEIEIIWYPSGEDLEDCNYIPERNKFEVFLETHDIDIVFRRLESAGLKISEKPHDTSWGFRIFGVRDPDNISIKVAQALP